ncbi:MAG: ferrous iron transport protein A [Phycisphaerales bacterium]|nr:ferrous iron transport protein A [Phycisphaerales bacterium]
MNLSNSPNPLATACCRGEQVCPGHGASNGAAEVRQPLTAVKVGDLGSICHQELDRKDADLLRAMGLRPQAIVRIRKLGDPVIVEVLAGCGHEKGLADACSCRIGVAGPLAKRLMFEPGPSGG